MVNRKELSPKYCRRMKASRKKKEEGNLLRALGVASASMEEERMFWLSPALFAKISSRARGTVLRTVLTAATPH